MKIWNKKSPNKNPKGSSTGEKKVIRGGAWNNVSLDLRGVGRHALKPDRISFDLGFRVVREVKKKPES